MELNNFLCTCKHAVNFHESVYFNQVNCLARFHTMLGISANCNQGIHYLTSYTDCTFCLLPSVIKTNSILFPLSLLIHDYTIILYQRVTYACGICIP